MRRHCVRVYSFGKGSTEAPEPSGMSSHDSSMFKQGCLIPSLVLLGQSGEAGSPKLHWTMRDRQAGSQGSGEPHMLASSHLEQLRDEERAGTTFYGLQFSASAPQISARDCLLWHAEIIAG